MKIRFTENEMSKKEYSCVNQINKDCPHNYTLKREQNLSNNKISCKENICLSQFYAIFKNNFVYVCI